MFDQLSECVNLTYKNCHCNSYLLQNSYLYLFIAKCSPRKVFRDAHEFISWSSGVQIAKSKTIFVKCYICACSPFE